MHRVIEPPLAPALGPCAMAWILLAVRHHPRMEDGLAIGWRIEAPIEMALRALETHARQRGHPWQGLHPLGQQHRIRVMDRGHRQGSQ